MLHKEFVLSSNAVRQNLMRLCKMWENKIEKTDAQRAGADLINTLLLMVPVISTTFASVQSFLGNLNKDDIGMLIVDGGYRKIGENSIWLGCPLVAHRRCLEPMFSIINAVAYDERMINKTEDTKSNSEFLLSESIWFDVKGIAKRSNNKNGKKDHTVDKQNKLVARLVKQAIDKNDEFPELFIITPFTTVDRSLKKILRLLFQHKFPELSNEVIEDWLKSNCGTIHTFQGKEEKEVLIVLGCDGQSGMGAIPRCAYHQRRDISCEVSRWSDWRFRSLERITLCK